VEELCSVFLDALATAEETLICRFTIFQLGRVKINSFWERWLHAISRKDFRNPDIEHRVCYKHLFFWRQKSYINIVPTICPKIENKKAPKVRPTKLQDTGKIFHIVASIVLKVHQSLCYTLKLITVENKTPMKMLAFKLEYWNWNCKIIQWRRPFNN